MLTEPRFNKLERPLDCEIMVGAIRFDYFGGTAYLGIPQNEDFLSLYLSGIKQYGLNNGTSRGNNIQLGIYDEAESYAAKLYGSEAALITSSGYLAAQLTVKNLQNLGKLIYAPSTHPALWLGEEAPKVEISFSSWAEQLLFEINASEVKDWVIVSNSMNNLYPEIYNFSFLERIDDKKQVVLIVDDSHGIGINHEGKSALSIIPKRQNIQTVLVASMAKALGVDAGLVLGPRNLIERLKNSNEFLGASPPAAAGLFAFMHAEEMYKASLAKLKTNIDKLASALAGNEDWHFIPNFPVFFCKNAELSARLANYNILASAFPYPKDGPLINRIVLSSWHTEEQLEKLITILTESS